MIEGKNIKNILLFFRLISTERIRSFRTGPDSHLLWERGEQSATGAKQRRGSAWCHERGPGWGWTANERHRRHRQPARRRESGVKGAPVRLHRRRRVNVTEAVRSQTERKSAHAAVARRAGGPQVRRAERKRILFSFHMSLRTAMTDKSDPEFTICHF